MSAKVKTKETPDTVEKAAAPVQHSKRKRAVSLAGTLPITGKITKRYPCGVARPEIPPAKIKRVVDGALLRADNSFLGMPIGWMHLHGLLNVRQLSAGIEYAKLRTRYDRIMGLPRRSARSFASLAGYNPPLTDDEIKATLHHFDELYAKLQKLGHPLAATKIISVLDDTCVDLVQPPYADQEALRIGLDKIAEHYRMSLAVRTQIAK